MSPKLLLSLATATLLLAGASNAVAQSQNVQAPQTAAADTANAPRPGGAAGPSNSLGQRIAHMFAGTARSSSTSAPKNTMADNR